VRALSFPFDEGSAHAAIPANARISFSGLSAVRYERWPTRKERDVQREAIARAGDVSA